MQERSFRALCMSVALFFMSRMYRNGFPSLLFLHRKDMWLPLWNTGGGICSISGTGTGCQGWGIIYERTFQGVPCESRLYHFYGGFFPCLCFTEAMTNRFHLDRAVSFAMLWQKQERMLHFIRWVLGMDDWVLPFFSPCGMISILKLRTCESGGMPGRAGDAMYYEIPAFAIWTRNGTKVLHAQNQVPTCSKSIS